MNFFKRWLDKLSHGWKEFWSLMNDPDLLDFLSSPASLGLESKKDQQADNEPPE